MAEQSNTSREPTALEMATTEELVHELHARATAMVLVHQPHADGGEYRVMHSGPLLLRLGMVAEIGRAIRQSAKEADQRG